MVRKGGAARRSSKHGSHISALKRLSLLDPEPPPLQTDPSAPDESPACPDQVYLHAAAIFQSTHLEKPAAHRLISYGSRSEVSVPAVRGEASQRLAYQLAFNTLKYPDVNTGLSVPYLLLARFMVDCVTYLWDIITVYHLPLVLSTRTAPVNVSVRANQTTQEEFGTREIHAKRGASHL
ncbi:putative methyltransferase NSUN7 [Anabarilius grahami]|uniref:Putative methyltransferase NSUN7 n=1 Tax=Anabarilius grahami TaxID=495550 RepID=A0A3N0Y4L5_ANAGA|nr:putative methyltransferase NSUN7 [Anabarilius grahami]